MNVFKRIGDTAATILGLMVIVWFGISCMKLGWRARDNDLLRPVVSFILGVEVNEEEKGTVGKIQDWLIDNKKYDEQNNVE
ncbi:hypothetical protein [Synechococcus sp. PCC 7335]|uniref:hypothetical protein n=1 Tax=Synechococcus sp. (strain ATCC 29403 / PCC 7335) TaxID=91464 RepID=UPI00056E2518|nr:hypothetical protein [Synechococcus sp. PCC 7335]